MHNRYAALFGEARGATVMLEAREGDIFSVERLVQLDLMTRAAQRLAGVDHERIESLAHTGVSRWRAGAAAVLRPVPLMSSVPATEKEAAAVRRRANATPGVVPRLVSADGSAAMLRLSFRDERPDARGIIDELERRIVAPYVSGWIGATLEPLAARSDSPARAQVDETGGLKVGRVFAGSAAQDAGLTEGDVLMRANGSPLHSVEALAAAVSVAKEVGVELGYRRGDKEMSVTIFGAGSALDAYIGGDLALEAALNAHAERLPCLLAVAALVTVIVLFALYRDWPRVLAPALTGAVATMWGLGTNHWTGSVLDPTLLVVPLFVAVRGIMHSMHGQHREVEDLRGSRSDGRDAAISVRALGHSRLVRCFAPDLVAVAALLALPVPALQRAALAAGFGLIGIVLAELALNPSIVALRADSHGPVLPRTTGACARVGQYLCRLVSIPAGRLAISVFWVLLAVACSSQWPRLQTENPSLTSPLLYPRAPFNRAQRRAQDVLGERPVLIVVAEGQRASAMFEPSVLAAMASLQRALERDGSAASSVSLADDVMALAVAAHEYEPKWGVLPEHSRAASELLLSFGATGVRHASADYRSAAIALVPRDTSAKGLQRLVEHTERFVATHPLDGVKLRLAAGSAAAAAALSDWLPRAELRATIFVYAAAAALASVTYGSWLAGFLVLVPLMLAGFVAHAFMAAAGLAVDLYTLAAVVLGIGFGAQFGLRVLGDTVAAVSAAEADRNAGTSLRIQAGVVQSLAVCAPSLLSAAMVAALVLATCLASGIRPHAVAAGVLGISIVTSAAASLSLLPTLLYLLRPPFLARARQPDRGVRLTNEARAQRTTTREPSFASD